MTSGIKDRHEKVIWEDHDSVYSCLGEEVHDTQNRKKNLHEQFYAVHSAEKNNHSKISFPVRMNDV